MLTLKRFLRDSRAATSIEYAIIGVLVSIAIIVGATAIGTSIRAKFTSASNGLS